MASFKTIKYPVSIKFRTNIDYEWSSDMSKYITSFSVNERIEDDPFTFVENEITLDIWDYDGGFIKSAWDSSIYELEVIIESDGVIKYYGYAKLVNKFSYVKNKNSILGIDSLTKKTTMHFGTGIERFNSIIDVMFSEKLTGEQSPFYTVSPRGILTISDRARLGDLLNFLFPDLVLDYSVLPIFNDNDKCFHYVHIKYLADEKEDGTYENKGVSAFKLLKDICKTYDCYLNYDAVLNKLTFYSRKELTDVESSLEVIRKTDKIFELNPDSTVTEYDGVYIVYDTTPKDKNDDGKKYTSIPSEIVYDIDGNWKYSKLRTSLRKGIKKDRIIQVIDDEVEIYKVENVSIENPNRITIILNKHSSEIEGVLDLSMDLLPYLVGNLGATGDYAMPDNIQNALYPNLELQAPLINVLIKSGFRYLNPNILYNITFQDKKPIIGESYGLETDNGDIEYGIITETNYSKTNSTNERITAKWKQMLPLPEIYIDTTTTNNSTEVD